jgi:HlyD family secretion protein
MAESEATSRRWLMPGIILLTLVGVTAGLRMTVLAPEPLIVRVAAVDRGPVEATVTNSKAGSIASRRRARLSAEMGGRVTKIYHREGDRVAAGVVLIRLNNESMTAQVDLVRAELEGSMSRKKEACLNSDLAGRDLERARQLASSSVVSDDEIDRLDVSHRAATAACAAAAADIERVAASVRASQAELAKFEIRAPFGGIIAEVNTEVGEWITPSPPLLTSPAVVDMLDPTSIYVSAPMDEVDSGRIRSGLAAKISVDSAPGQTFMGKVVRVAPYVIDLEAQNRTVEVEVEFAANEKTDSFLVGTSADVEIILEERPGALRIQSIALLEGSKALVLDNGELREAQLEIGIRNWDYAEVKSGLAQGDQVVVSLDRKEIQAGASARAEAPAAVGSR